MNEVQALLEKQARWQKSRQALFWPEKIRMAETIRESVRTLRQERHAPPTTSKAPATRPPLARDSEIHFSLRRMAVPA